MRKFLLIVVAALILASCTNKKADEKAKAGQPASSGVDYLIKIDNNTLTKEDIDKELKNLPENIKQGFFSDQANAEKFLDEFATKEIVTMEAKKRGIENDKDFLRRVEYFKKITAAQMLLEKELGEKSKVSDKEVEQYYKKNKDEFTSPPQMRLSHIMMKTEEGIKKADERLKKGEDFAKVAKDLSEDKESAKNGGDLGSFEKGKMPVEFNNAVANLKKGQVSGIVKTEFGFHIIKLADIKEGARIELNTVKENVRSMLSQEKQKDIVEKYIQDLRKKYKVEINKAAVEKVVSANQPKQDEGKQKEEKK